MSQPDVEWHSLFAGLGGGGVYKGHAGTRQYMDHLSEAWEIGMAEVDDALSCGHVAVLVGRIHYRGLESGVANTTPVGWTLVFRDSKLLRFQAYRDPEQVLRGVGLSS